MAEPSQTPVAILCGGRGTRLHGDGAVLAKPMVEVGGMPIVWHVVMGYYAAGFRSFVLLTGFLGDQVAGFAAGSSWPDDASVAALDTGIDTPTGGRVAALQELVGERTFCLTYADGLTDADLAAVLAGHEDSAAVVTLTLVRPQLPFGVVEVGPDDLVTGFEEKPQASKWVNGGFMCAGPELFAAVDPSEALEGHALPKLAGEGKVRASRHEGFWACMDTHKEASMLNGLWESGEAPWRRW